MNVRSVGLATELALAETRGTVTDRGDCLVVETADDPGYYYGNLLVLAEPPRSGDVARWRARFDAELGGNPAIRHVTFAWDGVDDDAGAVDELEAAGFVIEHTQVMCASSVASPASELPLRRLESAELTTDLAWAIADRHDESYRRFLHRRAAWHRDLIARDVAHWWGAFDGGTLVASLGIVDLSQAVSAATAWAGPLAAHARYQDVQTAAAYRRRGLASALLAAAANDALSRGGESVVIVADPGSAAARVYARAGFATIERTVSACLYPVSESRPVRAMTEP